MEISVNPLAVSKGKKLLCEICQQPARLQCAMCKATYYWWVTTGGWDIARLVEKELLFEGSALAWDRA